MEWLGYYAAGAVILTWVFFIGGTIISNKLPETHKFRKWWEKNVISDDPYHN